MSSHIVHPSRSENNKEKERKAYEQDIEILVPHEVL